MQNVSVGMNNFVPTRLESLRRLAPTGNHEEAHAFASPDARLGRIRIRIGNGEIRRSEFVRRKSNE